MKSSGKKKSLNIYLGLVRLMGHGMERFLKPLTPLDLHHNDDPYDVHVEKNVKKALEGTDVDQIKEATEKLTKVFYEISEKLYKANAEANAAAGATAEGNPDEAKEGTVYDADYKVEDDDNK